MIHRPRSFFHLRIGRVVIVPGLFVLVVCLAIVALGGSTHVRIRSSAFAASAGVHATRGNDFEEPNGSISDLVSSADLTAGQQLSAKTKMMPPTRGSFMAIWSNVNGASGFRLDVSTDASFAHYVPNYRDLDVGNVTSQIVAGLQPATCYYYRVRPYDSVGSIIGRTSEVATAQTASSNAGLVINPTFDTSITNNARAAAIEADINHAIAIYQSLFSDPINVSILFRYSRNSPAGDRLPTGVVAQSFFVIYRIPWDTAISALRGDAETPNDSSANASLPTFALSPNVLPSSANGRALGLDTPPSMFDDGAVGPGGPYDGIVTLNTAAPIQFTRPPGANSYDGLQAIEHEMDEILGLGSYLGHGGTDLRPQDLFSWSGFANRNTSTGGVRYFSIDNGQTDIVNFNQNTMGDLGDWQSDPCPQANPYVQNAFGCKGQFSDVTATSPEGINLDVIGYNLAAAASAPNAPIAEVATNVGSNVFTANWESAGGAVGYKLDVSTDNSFGSFVQGYQNLDVGDVTTTNVSGLGLNVTYYYRVRAYNGVGTSGNSNVVSVATTAATPTPTATPTPSPTPTPTPSITPGPDISVTWQNNALHDGNNPASPLTPPLTLKWQHDFTTSGFQYISYPLIAQGLVIVTTYTDLGMSVVAFDEATGQQNWSHSFTGSFGFIDAAYDAGKVFVVEYSGAMQAFDAKTGNLLWAVQLSQYAFTSPPTAVRGIVFVGGAGSGGTLYAVDENSGKVLWTGSVENGDSSSPAVTDASVFVSYACPQSYAFAPTTGQLQWHYQGPCEGGGGSTPVVHFGKVYVRDVFNGPNGLILDAQTGANVGSFSSIPPPAFVGNLAIYLTSDTTLSGVDVSSGEVLWSFVINGILVSAPVIVNQTIYIGSNSGMLYALDLQGNMIWSTQVGTTMIRSGEGGALPTIGVGSGDGLLVVPAGPILAVYASSNAPPPTPTPTPTVTPSPTSTASPSPTVTPTPTPTPTPTVTPTPTPTPTPTVTPTPTPTATPLPTSVNGNGTINAPGDQASFSISANKNRRNKWTGHFSYNDQAAGLNISANKLSGLTINGNHVHFSGSAKIAGKTKVTFTVDATGNDQPATLDTFSISVSDGYSASGNLTSGDVMIH